MITLSHDQLTKLSIFSQAEARRSVQQSRRPRHPRSTSVIKTTKKLLKVRRKLGILDPLLNTLSTQAYSLSSPFSLPPFESLGPMPMPENAPPSPYCLYPPNTPQPPSTAIPAPVGYTPSSPFYLPPALPIQSPPPTPASTIPGPPTTLPGPPEVVPSPFVYIPTPPESTFSPPYYEPSPPSYVLSPPSYIPSPGTGFVPSPPSYVPSPTIFVPSPPVFEPPVVYPPPTVPPPPNKAPNTALWCVAKPSVPDPIIQEAMDYACWSGADCASIQPDGACFQPNTLIAHASFAFNSFWQRTRVAGGTCEFGGTAILVTVDPSEFASKSILSQKKKKKKSPIHFINLSVFGIAIS
jgi:hypothetical protein